MLRPIANSISRAAPTASGCSRWGGNRLSASKGRRFLASSPGEGRLWRWTPGVKDAKPVPFEEFRNVTVAAAGPEHSGFVSDGILYTYGSNKYGQLGWEPSSSSSAPAAETTEGEEIREAIAEAADGHRPAILSLSMGQWHTAAISEGGILWTCGWGGSFWRGTGALGHDTTDTRILLTIVSRFLQYGEEIHQVACGDRHTVVLTNPGNLFTCGKGEFGRLGRGDTHDCLEFEEMDFFEHSNDSILNPMGKTELVKIDSGDNFSAVLSTDGELWIWGHNDYGQLGQGLEVLESKSTSYSRYPKMVKTLPVEGQRIVDVACGRHHVVVLTSAGAIYEWGNRKYLEPHPLTLPSRYEAGIKNLERVFAGDGVSFAVTTDGKLYAWGPDLSEGILPEKATTPTLVNPELFNGEPVVEVAADTHSCMVITERR